MSELLAPAGNTEALDAAINEGADAVYLGLKSFNARLRSSNFAWSQFEASVDSLHKRGKKVLVTVNTVLQEDETERMYRFLGYLARIGPDGIIVQDFGVLNMARTHFPSLRIHASTQMNIASARAANAMGRAGVSRVVLARELGLPEIREIKARTTCELEVFVHGALCVSESGLCLFSSYLGGKSANRGMCAQACRRLYTGGTGQGAQQGYYFSPHDLQLIDTIPDLVQAGVHSFKIEGRMKSAEYVGTVVSAYRYVLDNWETDRKGSLETARRILANDFARAKTRYWYDSSRADNILDPEQAGGTGIFLGKIDSVKSAGVFHLATLKGGTYDPEDGDSIRLHKKDDSVRSSHKVKESREEGGTRWIDVPEGFGKGDSVYLLQTKSMSKRYPHVLPKDLSPYRSQPGGEKLPPLKLEPPEQVASGAARATSATGAANSMAGGKRRGKGSAVDPDFPEGVYVQVSTIEDLYLILTDKPVRAILELNQATVPVLLGLKETAAKGGHGTQAGQVLPFAKREMILSIDPFLPQALEDGLSTTLDDLIENGYSQFILNNPGHIGMLRNRGLKLIAGPYLYSFNRWAVEWLGKQGLSTLVSPLENSRDNLEATIDGVFRDQVFVTVFAYPALFRMRFKLPESYDFDRFSDRQSGIFRAISTDDGSFVLPETPFSIADKSAALQKAGFTRHIVDISKASVRKQDYRAIMESYRKGQSLPEISRFNWKDGFYDPERMEELKEMNERAGARKASAKTAGRPGSRSVGKTGDTKNERRLGDDHGDRKPGKKPGLKAHEKTGRTGGEGRRPSSPRGEGGRKGRRPGPGKGVR